MAGVLPLDRLAEPGVVEGPTGSAVGVGGPKPRPVWSRRGGDPAVSAVVAVHGSEGAVLIDYRWATMRAAELAAARRAGSPS